MGIRDVKMLFAKREKGIFSQKTTLLGIFLEDNSGQRRTTWDNLIISFLRKMLSFVVLRCPELSSKILPLQKFYPNFFQFSGFA
jgi:hypothetical protein